MGTMILSALGRNGKFYGVDGRHLGYEAHHRSTEMSWNLRLRICSQKHILFFEYDFRDSYPYL